MDINNSVHGKYGVFIHKPDETHMIGIYKFSDAIGHAYTALADDGDVGDVDLFQPTNEEEQTPSGFVIHGFAAESGSISSEDSEQLVVSDNEDDTQGESQTGTTEIAATAYVLFNNQE